jgi:hypothetical protein
MDGAKPDAATTEKVAALAGEEPAADAKPVAEAKAGKDVVLPAPGPREREILALMATNLDLYSSEAIQSELAELVKARQEDKSEPEAEAGGEADADDEGEAPTEYPAEFPERPEDYLIPAAPAELGGERSEADVALLGEAATAFHEASLSQEQAIRLVKWWDGETIKREQAAVEAANNAVAGLRALYGADYKSNIDAANNLFREAFRVHEPDQEARTEFLALRLEDGTRIGDHPAFVRAMVDLARNSGRRAGSGRSNAQQQRQHEDDGPLVETMSDAALAREHRRIMGLMTSDEPEYKRSQSRLLQVLSTMNKRGRRGG